MPLPFFNCAKKPAGGMAGLIFKRCKQTAMTELKKKRFLIYLATFFFWFAQYVYNPYMTPYLLGLNITASFAGVIVGMYGSTQLICRLPLGVMADHAQKHRFFIVSGLLLCAAASLLRVLTQNPWALLGANAISGMASSTWISFTILNSMYYEPHELSRSIGSINAFNNAGILTAYILGGLLYEKYGMVMMFWLSLASGILGAVAALMIKDEPPRNPALPVGKLLSVIKQKRLIVFSLLSTLFQFIVFATANSFSSTVIKNIGATAVELSACSALFTLGGMLSSYFVGSKTAQKLGPVKLSMTGFGLLAIYCLVLPRLHTIWGMAILQFIGGCGGTSTFSIIMSDAIAEVPNEQRSTAMGFFQSVYSIGIMAGPSLMGTMIDRLTMTPAFAVVGIICIVTAAGYPLLRRFINKPGKA